MNDCHKLVKSAMVAFLCMVANQTALAIENNVSETEKCYGLVKAGMNDCATATSSCAGSALKDNQSDAFIFMPKGLCEKLSNGSLKSKTIKPS